MRDYRSGRTSLCRADWLVAGLLRLAAEGAAGLRVERLARDLEASKGSFYWHFNDLAAFSQAILDAWVLQARTDLDALARMTDLAPRERLLSLVAQSSVLPEVEVRNGAIEPAIREWGRHYPFARRALAEVDCARLEAVQGILQEHGHSPALARQGAEMIYGALIGLDALRSSSGGEVSAPLIAVAMAALALQAAPRRSDKPCANVQGAVAEYDMPCAAKPMFVPKARGNPLSPGKGMRAIAGGRPAMVLSPEMMVDA